MDITSLIVSLISGLLGGNIAGKSAKSLDRGALSNSIGGLVGGGIGVYLTQFANIMQQLQQMGIDIPAIVGNIGVSGISGFIITAILGMITKRKTAV